MAEILIVEDEASINELIKRTLMQPATAASKPTKAWRRSLWVKVIPLIWFCWTWESAGYQWLEGKRISGQYSGDLRDCQRRARR